MWDGIVCDALRYEGSTARERVEDSSEKRKLMGCAKLRYEE